eukprot:5476834-Pyramimonas_sp.AAC.1
MRTPCEDNISASRYVAIALAWDCFFCRAYACSMGIEAFQSSAARSLHPWPREFCSSATETLGGAPCGATILARGVPKWPEAAMRVPQLGPHVERPMGPRSE